MVYFDSATTDLVPGQSDSIQKIADELAGKPQQVEIVATASNQPLPRGCLFRDRWELSYARCRQTAEVFTALKIEPERLRLSVLPATGQENKGALFSEADVAVRVYLSAKLPAGR
jgi:flagellar motor protein MotB